MNRAETAQKFGKQSTRQWLREHSELGICVLLALLGGLVLVDTAGMATDFTQRGPVGPKTFRTWWERCWWSSPCWRATCAVGQIRNR